MLAVKKLEGYLVGRVRRMSSDSLPLEQHKLVESVYHVLLELRKDPYPSIPNPAGCKKRASVACIIRIRPNSLIVGEDDSPTALNLPAKDRIDAHFAKPWVKQGDPEILFIRRAAREGDRWTSQVALPGGKRDPEDDDDQRTSIREAQEEVGLHLDSDAVAFAGRLPGRIITTEWGTVPLMVLSPFVYLITDSKTATLTLQPNEIASAHWVPLRALLTQSLWTYEKADTSDRYAKRGGVLIKYAMRALLGHMLFGAIKLAPSESLYSSMVSGFLPETSTGMLSQVALNISSSFLGHNTPAAGPDKPLLLWGLTHGIIIDFLRLMPESDVLQSWRWPTFSAPDIRIAVWLASVRFRRQKLQGVNKSLHGPFMIIEEGFACVDTQIDEYSLSREQEPITHTAHQNSIHIRKPGQHSAVHYMLHGYFNLIQKGLFLSLALRLGPESDCLHS